MKTSYLFHRSMVDLLALSLLSAACIISDDDDGGGQSGVTDAGTPPPTTGSTPTSGPDGGTDDVGTDTGPMVCEGADNVVAEPGFESGPGGAWAETSMIFETVICDSACTNEEGAAPYMGDWWVWFGGLEAEDPPEEATVEQSITIPAGEEALLSFWFQIRSGAGTGNDVFSVDMVDGEVVDNLWMATDQDMPSFEGSYSRVDVDVTPWADGGTYTLRFSASIQNDGLTSFFLDEVGVVSCSESGTSTGVATEGEDTTVGMDETTAATMGTTGDTEGTTGTGTGTTGGSSSGG